MTFTQAHLIDAPYPDTDTHLREVLAWVRDHSPAHERPLGARFVEFHFGFVRSYARRTAFGGWDGDLIAAYEAELVAEMLRRLPGFDPARGYPLITYVKPYWQPVRWRVAGNEDSPLRLGVNSKRLRTAARGAEERLRQTLGRPATAAEIADEVNLNSPTGSPVTAKRIESLLRTQVMSDLPPDTTTLWDSGVRVPASVMADDAPTPEEQVVAAEEADERAAAVTAALCSLGLSDLERDIVTDRLMLPADEQTTPAALAARHGVRRTDVTATEARLVDVLRTHLADLTG